jgi:hypothetical protein
MVTSRQQLTKTLMFVDNEIKRTEEEEGGKRTLKDLGEIEGCVYSST